MPQGVLAAARLNALLQDDDGSGREGQEEGREEARSGGGGGGNSGPTALLRRQWRERQPQPYNLSKLLGFTLSDGDNQHRKGWGMIAGGTQWGGRDVGGLIGSINDGGERTALFAPFTYKMHYFTKTGSGQT